MTREEMVQRLAQTEAAMRGAGMMHRRDLEKHRRRLMKEIRDYDRYQEEARLKKLSNGGTSNAQAFE